jgi:hypothetical protein
MKLKSIFLWVFLVFAFISEAQESFKNEFGLNLMSVNSTWRDGQLFNPSLNISIARGVTYKRLFTKNFGVRAAASFDNGEYEVGFAQNDGLVKEAEYKIGRARVGAEYGYSFGKWKPYLSTDIRYTRFWEDVSSSGGITGGVLFYQNLTNKIAISPGIGLTYRVTPRISVSAESTLNWKVWDKGVHTEKYTGHQAVSAEEPYVEHFIWTPLSTFSLNYFF